MTPTIFTPQQQKTTDITATLNIRNTKFKEIENLKKQVQKIASDLSNSDERELLLETLWDLKSEILQERMNI